MSQLVVTSSNLSTLQDQFDQTGGLFAVVDACDEPKVPILVKQLDDRAVCLYRGKAAQDLWAFAPFLVECDEATVRWIINELSETPWGFFAFADGDLEALRRHFRRFLMVQDPDGKEMYFRFYDPRVLPPFLESCTNSERDRFFGPISSFVLIESGNATQVFERKPIPSRR